MAFKNAFKILISKFRLVWTLALYMAIISIILASLSLAFIIPMLKSINNAGIMDMFIEANRNLLTGQGIETWFENIRIVYLELRGLMQADTGLVVNTTLLITLVLVFASRFLIGLYEVPFVKILEDSMSSNIKTKFSHSFISKLSISSKFVLTKMIYTILYDGIVFLIIFALSQLFAVSYLRYFTPLIIMLFFIVSQAFRYSLIAMFCPKVVLDSSTMFKSFGYSVKKSFTNFGSIFSNFFVTWILIISLNILVGILTFGAGLFITVPLSMVFINLLNMTIYYGNNKKRYYLDSNTVYNPPDISSALS